MMFAQLARATQLLEEARLSTEQGNIDRAEVLSLESKEIFMQAGGAHFIDTAGIMNAIARMKVNYGDCSGALRAVEKSISILDIKVGTSPRQKADEIRLEACAILGDIHLQLAHYEKAEQVLLAASDHARRVFGESDERTASIRCQLAALYEQWGKLEKVETL